jgi:alpha-mannosidase
MTFDELIVLLPCQSLDDFPTNLKGEDAEGLLAGWSALWHPALLTAVGKMPTWRTAEFGPESWTGKLIVLPPIVEKTFTGDLESRAANEGAHLVRGLHRRNEIVAALLSAAGVGGRGPGVGEGNLAADFLALGTCVLFSELLVRRMRYSSNLAEGPFPGHLLAAATAAVAGKVEEARRNLALCCNTLVESRGRYYPVDMSLVDLTLVAKTTIGPALRKELAGGGPVNLLLNGESLAEMASREPESLAALRDAIERGTASVVGGEWDEAELPLLPLESILAEFQAGLAEYDKQLGVRPTVFARRRFGLSPALPQILHNLGFRAAVHVTLDDGRFPNPDSSKARWEGLDNSTIDALGRVPLDAREHGSFLALAQKIGHAMDHDHVATLSFAHWPGQVNPFYDDLRRIMAIAPVIGKFVTLDHYFTSTDSSGSYSRFTPDEYRSPYLQQDVAAGKADPLSRRVQCAQRAAANSACEALETLASLLRGSLPQSSNGPTSDVREAMEALATTLPREKSEPARGYLAMNPASNSRRVLLDVSELAALPTVKAPIKAADDVGGTKRVVVDLPPMGFAWIGPTGGEPGKNWSSEPLASGHTLRNEFCEVAIHPNTGGIQSVHDFRVRGNRLSQQLVFRAAAVEGGASSADPESSASRMVADSIEVTSSSRLFGEITSRGQLLDPAGRRLAGFVQRMQLSLGSRVVGLEIELDAAEPLAADPWNSYFASRFAWADRSAELRRSVHLQSHLTQARRIEAPHFVEIEAAEGRTALLTGGLPYHQRVGERMLDTLLAVHGESAKSIRLGIGVDVPHAWMAALDLLTLPIVRCEEAAPPSPVSYGWLFSLDAKNAVVTHWSPLPGSDSPAPTKVAGFRIRVLETEGRGGRVQLRSFRAPTSAQRTDFLGQSVGNLAVEADRVILELGAYEWIQADVRW